jgi:hypothetical protein
MNQEQAFLRSLYSALELSDKAELDAERINNLGILQGLNPERTYRLVRQMEDDGLVRSHWGAKISLTPTGKDQATRRTQADSTAAIQIRDINLGQGASANIASPGAVAGSGMGAGAVRIELNFGDLAAALQALRFGQAQLDLEAKSAAQALEDVLEATLQEAQTTTPDKPSLKQRLESAADWVDKLAKFPDAANKLGPAIKMIHQAVTGLLGWCSST